MATTAQVDARIQLTSIEVNPQNPLQHLPLAPEALDSTASNCYGATIYRKDGQSDKEFTAEAEELRKVLHLAVCIPQMKGFNQQTGKPAWIRCMADVAKRFWIPKVPRYTSLESIKAKMSGA